ncbi:MAG: DUF4126 domain-containing protein [Gemmatimonadaceae bacterium]|jgi:uncharacterized membrane protein|nr:DUF4126 domain-containing protein [Gemmatimonadaceae bacterium]
MASSLSVGPDVLLSLAVGLGLASAAGLRVFVPVLAAAVAGARGLLPLDPSFWWLTSTPALLALGTATVLEIAAYYVPWVDHALDVVATPVAVLAGMVLTASVAVDVPPLLKWAAVLIGGGAAGLTQGASVVARIKSAALTGGLANPLVSTAELAGALVVTALAVFVPVVALGLVLVALILMARRIGRLAFGRRAAPPR